MDTTLVDLLTQLPHGERALTEKLLTIFGQQGCNPITVSARELGDAMGYGHDEAGAKQLGDLLRSPRLICVSYASGPQRSVTRSSGSLIPEVARMRSGDADQANGDSMLRVQLSGFLVELYQGASPNNAS